MGDGSLLAMKKHYVLMKRLDGQRRYLATFFPSDLSTDEIVMWKTAESSYSPRFFFTLDLALTFVDANPDIVPKDTSLFVVKIYKDDLGVICESLNEVFEEIEPFPDCRRCLDQESMRCLCHQFARSGGVLRLNSRTARRPAC